MKISRSSLQYQECLTSKAEKMNDFARIRILMRVGEEFFSHP